MSTYVPGAGTAPVTLISRSEGKLDAFAVGLDGGIYTAAWEPGDKAWRGWWRIGDIEAAPCAPITAVSRSKDKLDIFVVALDSRIHTAAWQSGDTAWRGWWPVADLKTVLHAQIGAATRSLNKLDLVVTDLDGKVHAAAWQPGDTAFRGWWRVGQLIAPPGAPVSLVSRSTDKLDAFATGTDGRVYTAAWQPADTAWRGWWPVANFVTAPRSPVGAVSRSPDKLDVFATGTDGRVYTAAWQPGDAAWRGWWPVGGLFTGRRAAVTAVSRSPDKLDVFCTGTDGRVYTAAWQPGDKAWRGWWPVADLLTTSGLAVGAASRGSDMLDVVASGQNGRVYAAAWQPGDKQFRGWWFVGDLITGMADPGVSSWKKVGVALYEENTSHSEEAQGATTDGDAWFVVSNNSNTVRKYGAGGKVLGQVGVPPGKAGAHIGAPGFYEGWVYVPTQGPFGAWKTSVDFSKQATATAADGGKDRFPWCDVNPLNGRLYTSEFDHWNNKPGIIFAYDRDTLERRPEDDLQLGTTPIHFDRIQGGVFTRRGRLILSRSGPNGVFCFSAVTGHCFGARKLGNYGSTGSEVEGVTVRPWWFKSTEADVHILELDNDATSKDDFYLHSYRVPEPARL